jgi:predicted amidohydrolase
MRAAVIQLNSRLLDRHKNVVNALKLVDEAAQGGARFVLLPECMTFMGAYEHYDRVAEQIDGPTAEMAAESARKHGIYLHIGSLTERSPVPGKYYNTSLLFNPQGELIATYRKVHLFDIDVPGQVSETESAFVLPGEQLVTVSLPEFHLGLSICFDLRFPELYRALAQAGAQVLVIPSAFSRPTGRAHWHALLRARAIENHAYVLAACQYGTDKTGHWVYGHSLIVDPWGVILAEAPANRKAVLFADLDMQQVEQRREQIQVLKLVKPAVYKNLVTR